MPTITLKKKPYQLSGSLPSKGSLPSAQLVSKDLKDVDLHQFFGSWVILNIFPSLDTEVCALSIRHFTEEVSKRDGVQLLNISMDLPFASQRFCQNMENHQTIHFLSCFRSEFKKTFGLEITEGPLKGLCARACLVADPKGEIVYSHLVEEVTQEPPYQEVLHAIS